MKKGITAGIPFLVTMVLTISNSYSFQPDLIIESIFVSTDHPNINGTMTVEVTVKNQGNASSGGFYVDLLNGTFLTYDSDHILDLQPNFTATAYIIVQNLTAEHWKLNAVVDGLDDVNESDENNNYYPVSPNDFIDIAWMENEIASGYGWPIGVGNTQIQVNGKFGENRVTHFHHGIDIQGSLLTPVYSVSSGEVLLKDDDEIQIGGFRYIHLASIPAEFKVNSYWVEKAGVLIGYTNTLNHVHLEDGLWSGIRRNPLSQIVPYNDTFAPVINTLSIAGPSSFVVEGSIDIIANAEDRISPPGKFNDLNVYKIGYDIIDNSTSSVVPGQSRSYQFDN